ncbi:unnamed protein product [Mytilus coruscus]|uniref:Uncharacterized protein n=1 Tax=Mytilus coruscus TaxID=42192 RepID=A0A6J8DI78_MYTCO|nr:unnamed protein product [Mytilus coruscus]
MPRGKGKRVLPNRAARRQDNHVQLPANRMCRTRRAEIIGQNEANPQQPLMPPQQPLMPPQQPLLPPHLPQQPIVPTDWNSKRQPTARNIVQNGEILVIPTSNDVDVFVPQKIINQIWNLEYVDLAQLLYKNFVSNIDQPKKVLGFDEDGDILIERNKYSKVKSLSNIGEWTEGFLNYMKILLQRFPDLANELITYMTIIRRASVPFENVYKYDKQFRLRKARDHMRAWDVIDGQVWLQFIAVGIKHVQQTSSYTSHS